MTKISRKEAMKLLASVSLLKLSHQERVNILIDELSATEIIIEKLNYDDNKWNPIIIKHLICGLRGVRNGFLEGKVAKELGVEVKVVGVPEKMIRCKCCNYRSLSSDGEFDICPVCFWEDDGVVDEDAISSPNKLSLKQGRENFQRHGYSYDSQVQIPDTDRFSKYEG